MVVHTVECLQHDDPMIFPYPIVIESTPHRCFTIFCTPGIESSEGEGKWEGSHGRWWDKEKR